MVSVRRLAKVQTKLKLVSQNFSDFEDMEKRTIETGSLDPPRECKITLECRASAISRLNFVVWTLLIQMEPIGILSRFDPGKFWVQCRHVFK